MQASFFCVPPSIVYSNYELLPAGRQVLRTYELRTDTKNRLRRSQRLVTIWLYKKTRPQRGRRKSDIKNLRPLQGRKSCSTLCLLPIYDPFRIKPKKPEDYPSGFWSNILLQLKSLCRWTII